MTKRKPKRGPGGKFTGQTPRKASWPDAPLSKVNLEHAHKAIQQPATRTPPILGDSVGQAPIDMREYAREHPEEVSMILAGMWEDIDREAQSIVPVPSSWPSALEIERRRRSNPHVNCRCVHLPQIDEVPAKARTCEECGSELQEERVRAGKDVLWIQHCPKCCPSWTQALMGE